MDKKKLIVFTVLVAAAKLATAQCNLVQVNPTPSNKTICYGDSVTINLAAATSSGGTIYYTWQQRTNVTSWIPVQGVVNTNTDLTTPLLTTDSMYYRRMAYTTGCTPKDTTIYSDSVLVRLFPKLKIDSITPDTLVINCSNAPFEVPLTVWAVSEGKGTPTFQWDSSKNGSSWTTIVGATNNSYLPPASTTTSYYFQCRVTLTNNCGRDSTIRFHIQTRPNFSAGNIAITPAGNTQTICYNTTPPKIGNATTNGPASGGGGKITYRWIVTDTNTKIADTINKDDASYMPDSMKVGTFWYERQAKDSACGVWKTSGGKLTLTVHPRFTAGAIDTVGEYICKGNQPSTIGVITSASGGDGNITYQWKINNGTPIAGTATHTPTVSAVGTHIYTREARNQACSTGWVVSEGSWTLIIDSATIKPNKPSGKTSLCKGTDSVTSYYTNNVNGKQYIWSLLPNYGTISGNGSSISVHWDANAIFTVPCTLKVRVTPSCDTVFSDALIINMYQSPIIAFTSSPNPVCPNVEYTYSVTNVPGISSYSWYAAHASISGIGNERKITWDKLSSTYTSVLTVIAIDGDCYSNEVFDTITVGASEVQKLNKIVAKTDKNRVPYMLIYPNPTGKFAYQWYKNDTAIANAIEQYFYPPNYNQTLENGAKYKVYVVDLHDLACGGGFTDVYTVSKSIPQSKYFVVSPNPADGGYFTVSFNRDMLPDNDENSTLSIYSMVGNKVWEQKINILDDVHIPVTTLTSGVYSIILTTDKQRYNEQLIIK